MQEPTAMRHLTCDGDIYLACGEGTHFAFAHSEIIQAVIAHPSSSQLCMGTSIFHGR
jgi:hypothetical protein